MECLRDDLGADLASANLVLTGTSSVLARSNGEVVDLLAGGQGVFNIVPLAGVLEELEADIVRLDDTGHRIGGQRHGRRRHSGRGPRGSEPDGPCARRAHTPSGLCARRDHPFRASLRATVRGAPRPLG